MAKNPALKSVGIWWSRHGVAAVAVGVIALALRVWGRGWSLPYVDHPDEPAVIDVVLRIVQGQANPDFFFYPSLMLYLHALLLKFHFWWGLQTGLYAAPLSLPPSNHFYTGIPAAFLWARTLTALLGAATAATLAAWGSRSMGRSAAVLGGLLLALSPWAIAHGHYVTVDIPAAFSGALALFAALAVLDRGTRRDYLIAGALIGLAAATKYQNVLLAASLALAHLLRWRREALARGGRLIAAGLLSAAVFLATSPYILLDFAAFSRDIRTLVQSYDGSHGDVRYAWPVFEYLEFLWREGLGPLPALLALIGAAALIRRRPAVAAVLLSFPLMLAAALLRVETHFFRNLLPAQPPLLLLGGYGAVAVWNRFYPRLPSSAARPSAALTLLAVLLPSLLPALEQSAGFARPDSRIIAQEWARSQRPGVHIASEISHPLLWNGIAQASHAHYLPLHSMDWYRSQGYGLLLASSATRQREDWTADYEPLLTEGRIIATFGGRGTELRGPRIDLIEMGLLSDTLPTSGPQATIGPVRLLGVTIGRLAHLNTGPEVEPGWTFRAGDILAITAFWTLDQPAPAADYVTFVHLRDEQGRNLTQRDVPPWFGLFPPQSWQPGSLVTERLDLPLPANLPPGKYSLVLGMYDSARQVRYVASIGGAQLANDEVNLGTIEVVP